MTTLKPYFYHFGPHATAKFYYAFTMAKMFVLMGILGITCANCGFFYLLMKYAFKDLERLMISAPFPLRIPPYPPSYFENFIV